MAVINVRRDVTDPFYRYKMESLQSKVEGKGNGIKTVIVNLTSVAQSLARPPSYLIKYFGFELGAQTNTNPADDRWIINGAHEANKLQDYLDGFISRYVLCKKCKNPETDVQFKDGRIFLDCKACGQRSEVDPRLKLSSFILKTQPKKGKKDKATKKAERKARKGGADTNGHTSRTGSPDESNSDHGSEENKDGDDVDSDDELKRIQEDANELQAVNDEQEVKWSVDTSEAAVKARANQLSEDLRRNLTVGEEDEENEEGGNAYEQLGTWVTKTAEEKGGVSKVEDVDIYLKAKELGIESKHRTLTVLAQTVFDDRIVKQIDARAAMLKKMITSEKHEKAFLGGTERMVGVERPNLTAQVSAILMKYYDNDLVTEKVLLGWGTKSSKKYVDIATSRKVRKSAEKFITWLENAQSDDDDGESDSDDRVLVKG